VEQDPVGLIGAGLLGSAIAERLLGAGYEINGFDTAEAARAQLMRLGATAMSPEEIAGRCRRVVLCLPEAAASAGVIGAIRPHLRPGSVVIDTTTTAPDHAAAMCAAGVEFMDCDVGGSSQQLRDGEAVLMVGATPAALEVSKDLLAALSARWFHCGPPGSGSRMKLVFNLVLGLNRAVLAEGLAFAGRTGVDPRAALDVLRSGVAYSRVMDTKGAKMLDRDFEPQARLAQHLKDVRIIVESGEVAGARLPLSLVHRMILDSLDQRGLGGLDNSAVIEWFQS